MRLTVLCGYCRGALAADVSRTGSAVTCPRCRAVVEVPPPVAESDLGRSFEVVDDEPAPAQPRRTPRPEPEPPARPKRRPSARPTRLRRGKPAGSATKTALLVLVGLVVLAGVVTVLLVLKRDRGKPGTGGSGPNTPGAPTVPDGGQWETGPGYELLVPSRGERRDGLAALGDAVHPDVAARSKMTSLTADGVEFLWGHYPAPWGAYGLPPGESAALLSRMIDQKNGRDVYVTELNGHPARDYSYSLTGRESHVRLAVVNDTLVLVAVRGAGLAATDARVKTARDSLRVR